MAKAAVGASHDDDAALKIDVEQVHLRIEPFPASHGDIYRARAMDVNVSFDDFDAMIASRGSGLLAKV